MPGKLTVRAFWGSGKAGTREVNASVFVKTGIRRPDWDARFSFVEGRGYYLGNTRVEISLPESEYTIICEYSGAGGRFEERVQERKVKIRDNGNHEINFNFEIVGTKTEFVGRINLPTTPVPAPAPPAATPTTTVTTSSTPTATAAASTPTAPPRPRPWWLPDWRRLIIAVIITILTYLFFYQPIVLQGLGFNDPFSPPWAIFNILVPLGFFAAVYYVVTGKGDPQPIVIASIVSAIVWLLLNTFPISQGPNSITIQLGLPFLAWIISYWRAVESKGNYAELIFQLTGILALVGIGFFLLNLFTSGAFLNIETYLRPLDVLTVVGIPQASIDNFKQGIRDSLSFLGVQGVSTLKPEAVKVGGFEAIQFRFGNRFQDYNVPQIFARANYVLPISVTNPNSIESNLQVKNFYIDEAYLLNSSSNRALCGNATSCYKYENGTTSGRCLIEPNEEQTITIEFNDNTSCSELVKTYDDNYKNSNEKPDPLYQISVPVEVSKTRTPYDIDTNCTREASGGTGFDIAVNQDQYNSCVRDRCVDICKEYVLVKHPNLKLNNIFYSKLDNTCKCNIQKFVNNVTEFCHFDGDKSGVEVRSHFDFSVQGKGELIAVKKESNQREAPGPKITSSAGPLTVTTYFIVDTYIAEKPQNVKMFVDIKNSGTNSGNAVIKNISYTVDPQVAEINSCSPVVDPKAETPKTLFVDSSGTTIVCNVDVVNRKVTEFEGKYMTIPVIVDMNYTYNQVHSTTLTIKKASIPPEVTGSQRDELERTIKDLPYYCPADLKIYGPYY